MEITALRKRFTVDSTISDVLIDGQFVGHFLEDQDRGLEQTMNLAQITARKVKGRTAIPAGRYEVAISYSNRFRKLLPLLLAVPGYEGIRIHPGNVAADTEGCLLPGLFFGANKVLDSRAAFTAWFLRIQAALRTEKVYLTIARDPTAFQAFTSALPKLNQAA
ncbi:DUF5675 family protein [Larkinella humicola]|uniref:DUF5675 family protein n=1 Tax=Larkinella humicola TaxID=2607654 RepID=UPI0017804315|nr:DUF5675 family protein [Larkinella humicola]